MFLTEYFTMAKIIQTLMVVIHVILKLTRPFSELALDVFCRIFYGGTKPLPAITNKILLMSATELARKIRKKEISAVEVMKTYISRIQSVQPLINACIDNRFEEALADARAVDRMLEEGTKTEDQLASGMPLLGVPFSCKEIIGVKNLAQTNCLKSLKDRKAPEDSEVASLYRLAGAIPVVVTNIPTLTLWWDTSNPVFGSTKNPYNFNRTAGGSSGGEAALIASAGSVIGLGNDLGGSIRVPASMCGIYGHKPTPGVISNKSSAPVDLPELEHYFNTGPMCRYSEDLHVLVGILSGDNKEKLRLDEKVDFKNVKVYYMEEFPGYLLSASSDVKAAVRKAVQHFEEEFNITPVPVKIKELKYAFEIWMSKLFEATGVLVRKVIAGENGKFCLLWEYAKYLFGFSDYDLRNLYFAAIELQKKDKSYEEALQMFDNVEKKLQELLDGDAILILPIQPERPVHTIVTIPKFKTVGYTAIFNVLGLPGTAVPTGLSKGLPLGIQIIAAKNNDRLTLAAAVELDMVFGGWKSPCPVLL